MRQSAPRPPSQKFIKDLVAALSAGQKMEAGWNGYAWDWTGCTEYKIALANDGDWVITNHVRVGNRASYTIVVKNGQSRNCHHLTL